MSLAQMRREGVASLNSVENSSGPRTRAGSAARTLRLDPEKISRWRQGDRPRRLMYVRVGLFPDIYCVLKQNEVCCLRCRHRRSLSVI